MTDHPCVLVVDDEPIHRRFASKVLSSVGWRVVEADGGALALATLAATSCSLLLLDIQMPAPDGFEVAQLVRTGDAQIASMPILAFTTLRGPEAEARIRASGMDGYIAKPCTPDTLIAAAKPWWPGKVDPATAKLTELFGEEEMASLIAGFREQLDEALRQIADPDGAPRAHRIAGIAGTLGFSEVYEPWLALSEGDRGAIEQARRSARKALRMIDLGLVLPSHDDEMSR